MRGFLLKKLLGGKLKYFIIFAVLGTAGLSIFLAKSCLSGSENTRFEKYIDKIFYQEISSNTLNLHYTLAYPEDYGIRDYQISILLGRLYKAEMPGTHNIRILPYDALYSPAALCYIPLKPSYEADIRRSIHIELQIEQIPYALIVEDHKTIHDNELCRFDTHHLIHPAMMDEIILRHHYRLSALKIGKILDHEIHVKGIRMVEIIGCYIIIADKWRAFVVIVLGNEHGGVDRLLYPSYNSAFP